MIQEKRINAGSSFKGPPTLVVLPRITYVRCWLKWRPMSIDWWPLQKPLEWEIKDKKGDVFVGVSHNEGIVNFTTLSLLSNLKSWMKKLLFTFVLKLWGQKYKLEFFLAGKPFVQLHPNLTSRNGNSFCHILPILAIVGNATQLVLSTKSIQ